MDKSQIISRIAEIWYGSNCSFDDLVKAILNDNIQALQHIRNALISIARLLETQYMGERLSRHRLENLSKYHPELHRQLMQKLSEVGIPKKTFYNLTVDKQQEIIGIELHRRLLSESKNIKMQDEKATGQSIRMSEE